jgi:molybdate transport system ATP-binding protein
VEKHSTALPARVVRHDAYYGLSLLQFSGGEMKVPQVAQAPGSAVTVTIVERDVAIALTRPMDVSVTNRLPGRIVTVEPLERPYVRVRIDLGGAEIAALVTAESVDRLGLEPGLAVWALIKSVAIGPEAVTDAGGAAPEPRPWPPR